MELSGKKVLVFGAGVSGIGAADLLEKVGAEPVLFDGNPAVSPEEVRAKLPGSSRAGILIGDWPSSFLDTIDLAVLSPGVPTDSPKVQEIRSHQIPVWGEVELAYRCGRGDILAITGTNGKTTVTTLVGEILKYHRECGTLPETDAVFVVGNIGTPYTGAALQMTDKSVSAAEISSFQLETIESFHPQVSAITNITPDHLNRHHTMEEYIRVKENVCRNQTAEDTCVLNYEDPVLRGFGEDMQAEAGRPKVIFFSSGRTLENGYFLRDGMLFEAQDGQENCLISVKELHLVGVHNYENVMTAMAVTHAWGVPVPEIIEVLKRFTAVEHRIEYVAEKNGIVFYNDSKGTNPDAAIKGIQAMDRPTVLIGGGYDKDSDYHEWIRSFDGKVKCLVLTGQTKEKIAQAAKECGFHEIILTDTFEEAFARSVEKAAPGDAVLLSPACASWGMFPNYEVRGRVFKELVYKYH